MNAFLAVLAMDNYINRIFEINRMTIKTRKLHLLIPLCIVLSTAVQANNVETSDTTHLGHDYPRQLVANKAKLSSVTVEMKYKVLLSRINVSTFPGDKDHNAETANYLESEHQQWKIYRDSHCQLKANVYIYPSDSRMWATEFHSCLNSMNEKRIKFLNGISYEYKK